MVRIDAQYLIPFPRKVVWEYLTHPEREHEYGWAMPGANQVLYRTDDSVRFRTSRDRGAIGRGSIVSVFDGRFDEANWRIRWRIVEGFEEGSDYVEELLEVSEGTRMRVHGTIALKGVDLDLRLKGLLFPWKARAFLEGNLCRDYKRLKEHLQAVHPRP